MIKNYGRYKTHSTSKAALVLSVILAMLLVACSEPESSDTIVESDEVTTVAETDQAPEGSGSTTAPSSDTTIDSGTVDTTLHVGALLPLTGTAAGFGEDAQQGTSLCETHFSENPVLEGMEVKVHFEDNEGTPEQAVTGYQRLRSQYQVPAVISSLTSPTLAVASQATEDEVVVFNGGNGAALTQAGPYFFSSILNLNISATIIAGFAVEELDISTVALAYRTDDYGIGGAEVFKQALEAAGGEIVEDQTFAPDTTDFQAQATQIVAADPDAVFVLGFGQELAGLLQALERGGYEGAFLSDSGFGQPEVIELVPDIADGRAFFALEDWNPAEPPTPAAEQFVADVNSEFGEDPTINHIRYYEACEVLVHAAATLLADGTEPTGAALREQIEETGTFETVTGSLVFTPSSHFAARPLSIRTVTDGTFATYEPLSVEMVETYMNLLDE